MKEELLRLEIALAENELEHWKLMEQYVPLKKQEIEDKLKDLNH